MVISLLHLSSYLYKNSDWLLVFMIVTSIFFKLFFTAADFMINDENQKSERKIWGSY